MEERICGVEVKHDRHITINRSNRSICIFFSLLNLIPNQKSTIKIELKKLSKSPLNFFIYNNLPYNKRDRQKEKDVVHQHNQARQQAGSHGKLSTLLRLEPHVGHAEDVFGQVRRQQRVSDAKNCRDGTRWCRQERYHVAVRARCLSGAKVQANDGGELCDEAVPLQ